MSQVVDQLAELTTLRDRDLLDVTLATVFRDLLLPLRVAIHRCVGAPADCRWLTRANLHLADLVASSDPPWTELDQLPRLVDFPLRLQALRLQQVVTQPGTPHLSVFPLTTEREVAGVLEIESTQALGNAEYRLVGSMLRVYRNFQGLLDYSERDTLTGLLNRKTFDEAFSKLGAGPDGLPAEEPGLGLSDPPDDSTASADRRVALAAQPRFIGVIDIDHFKLVNDRHGHLIGDEVLLLLSRLMRSVFRFHDQLFRFGGEEFVVLMRCHSDADASVALERLRLAVKGYLFPPVGNITVSAGYTRVRSGDTPSTAFERADRAVYWAKGHGRDQVSSYADLADRGELADDAKVGDVELF